ncbi:MAG: Ig-like domain-containing protein [Longicatena caecimuris]|uniref:Ig-like domain-containing protein n=1 Tax=Longicatena caecimuris TaxID=1796635 RepID=UPI00399ABC5E
MKKIMMSIFAGILSISCMTLPIEGKTRCSSEVSRAADDFYDGYQYDETTGCYYELLPYEDAYVKVFLPKNTEAFMIPAKIAGYPVKEVAIKSYAYGLTDKYAEAYNKLKQINVAKDNAYFSSQNGVLYDKEGTTLRYYPAGKPETSFIVPAKVKDIANFAFISNRYLQTLDTNGLTSIGFGAFYDSNIQKLKINKTLKDIAFGVAIANMPPTFGKCKQLKAFEVDAGNQNFSTIDGVLFNKDCSKLIYYPNAKGQFYTVPNNTKTISQYAFWLSGYDSGEMKQLTIGKHVTNFVDDVRSTTFNGCGKASIRCYKDSYAYTICLQKGMNVITIPEKIALNCVSKTLEKNATYSFKLTTFPSDASRSVTWRTGNSKVANIDKNGKVTAVNAGNTYIYAKTPEGLEAKAKVTVILPSITKTNITVSNSAYTGSQIKPSITIKDGTKTLKNGTDYTVSYGKNTALGKGTVKISGKGNYIGSITKTFTISKRSVTTLSYGGLSARTYTGKAIKPSISVKYGKTTLKNGRDYTVSYGKNISPGKGTVKISGKGNYTGSITKTFTISKRSVTTLSYSSLSTRTYTGKAIKPSITVKYGKTTLKNGRDYTLSYGKNVATGKGTVKITGKGNYSGTITKSFKIVPKKPSVSIKAGKGSLKVTAKATGASGYQIAYATSAKGKLKYVTSGTSKTLKLSRNKTYYVKVRAYKTMDGKSIMALTVR